MARPSPEKIADIVLGRSPVYGLDADSRIREVANRMTARALFEILGRMDDEAPDFAAQLSSLLAEFPGEEVSVLIGFRTGKIPLGDDEPESREEQENRAEFYLRLVFRDEDAAYYQFALFPDLEAGYVRGSARKRAGAVQHLWIELSCPEALQWFIESCRCNPHFLRVEESTAEEFQRAPSNAM